MPHLLGHHALQRQEVVIGRRVVQQVALLLDRGEFGVALIDDQIEQRVADALIGNVHHRRPLALAFVVAELYVRHLRIAELRLELERAQRALGQPNRVLPVFEIVNPVVEVVKFADHFSDSLSVGVLLEWRTALPDRRFRCRAFPPAYYVASDTTRPSLFAPRAAPCPPIAWLGPGSQGLGPGAGLPDQRDRVAPPRLPEPCGRSIPARAPSRRW